jgi:hypothetical protein
MIYLTFIFALALACLAGMEFIALMVLETRIRQLKRRVAELEGEKRRVSENLRNAQASIGELREKEEETWPELINDDSIP